MKRIILLLVLIIVFCPVLQEFAGANNNGVIRTSIVMQNWKIENVNNRIAEGTFPIEVILPLRKEINLQILHSPAISRFGNTKLSGLSDTWIRSSYIFSNEKMMISSGIGLPTGKTGFTKNEVILLNILSQNALKFRLPVYGQGLTISTGIIYAHPLSEQFAIGGGVNFVYQGKYKYTQYDFNPGEQFGFNIGFDYNPSPTMKLNLDILYTYYMKDKMKNNEIFGAGVKIGARVCFLYSWDKKILKIAGSYRSSGKNETWNGTTLITEPKNSNIPQTELEALYSIMLSQMFSFDILFEGRLYMENEYGIGQTSILGGGIKNNIQLTPKLKVNIILKLFNGNAYYNTEARNFSGKEFQIGTIIRI